MTRPLTFTPPRWHRFQGWLGRVISPEQGKCVNCGWSWYWGGYHTTEFKEPGLNQWGGGCFPLCEVCWAGMTPDQRLPFYRELFERWQSYGKNTHNWAQIKRAVMAGK